jgi:predicted nucleotide-binding protein (sugar kinase/HSP70/actin superfamily)
LKVGIPKGLLYHKYHPFAKRFFNELGSEIIESVDTNRVTLNEGSSYCVDEACLPIKIFHGHVANIKDKCDVLIIPRIMSEYKNEFICPKFCGLPEMITSSIPGIPRITKAPIYLNSKNKLYDWCMDVGSMITKDQNKIRFAYKSGMEEQKKHKTGLMDENYRINIALVGHPYNVYDNFTNMDIVKKLNKLGVGVRTEETLGEVLINQMSKELYKRPFWTFARKSYGFSTHMAVNRRVDGIVYISSFACGIDSVVIELIKNKIEYFPFLILKVDEHTGEAGFNTRIEAFVDMLGRSC